jgi:class 3 adenylate cyclase/tetratricopeptide (TPR) repeat protein
VDVAAWLRSLGLQQFEQAFRQNAIEADVLPELTYEHLRELGLPLGDRLRLLKAIDALRSCQARDRAPTSPAPAESAPNRGERRQVTALFADIVGYTALIRELGAEEIHELSARFFETVDHLIDDHGGSVDKHIGDCVMAVFGAPVAHGNDTERAVRTALAIRDAMPELSILLGRPVGVHIGIAGGQVVASRTGSVIRRQYEVTGETVNLAARLTEAAKSGEILVSETVWHALADRLEGKEASDLTVKGFANPVRAWRVFDLRPAVAADGPPLVGRHAELNQFKAILRACRKTGRGQAVYVRGEAGIGKTRLVEEFQSEAKTAGFECHAGLVLDFGAGAERDAIRAVVRGLLNLDIFSDAECARAAAAAALSRGLVEAEQLVFLNDLLDIPQPRELLALYDAMDNGSRVRGKRRTLAEVVERTSRQRPRLLTVEDVHWADRSTLAHLAELTAVVAECPAVLIMTSRSEGDPLDQAWQSRTRSAPLTTIDLGPLRREEALTMAEALLHTLDELVSRCVERAAGNPLFLEQLLRHAKDNARGGGVPGSVQSLVQARMDRLDPADKQALQAASVLGQRFGTEMLGFVLDRPDYTPEHLIAHRFVRPQGEAVLFVHALVRDAVYDTLLKSRRRALHRRAAECFSGRDPVLYAEHLDRADDPEAPRAYLSAARSRAAEYRHEAAIQLVERGRALAVERADRFALACLHGDLLHDLGAIPTAESAYRSALDAAESCAERCRGWIGLAALKRVTDDLEGAFADLGRAEVEAVEQGLLAEQARIHFLRGNLFFPRGAVENCLREHQQTLELARQTGSAELEAMALGGLGDAECLRGRMLSARDHFRHCVELSRQHGFGGIEVANWPMLAFTRWFADDASGALGEALAAIEAAVRVGHRRAEIIAQHVAYSCRHALRDLDGAWGHVERALTLSRTLRARRFEAQALAFRGELNRLAGRRSDALADVGEALSISRETGMAYMGPCILAVLALVTDDPRVRDEALIEGQALLAAGAPSYNHFLFRRDAIEACLEMGAWDRVESHAAALEDFARPEPTPWTDYIAARGQALAAWGRARRDDALLAELAELTNKGERLGLKITVPAIEVALSGRTHGRPPRSRASSQHL